MASIHDQLKSEGIVKEAGAMLVVNKLKAHSGQLYLTPGSLVFVRNGNAAMVGALGGFIGASMRQRVAVEIPLDDVTGVQRSKHGRATVLDITTSDGKRKRIAVSEYEEWAEAILAGSSTLAAAGVSAKASR
jgi:hypothetical protein